MRNRRLGNRLSTGIVITTALAVGLALAGCSSDSSGPGPSTPSVKTPSSEAASPSANASGSDIGKPIAVGSATYTVESVKNIGKNLSSAEGESLAQGEFVVIKMTVANNGGSTLKIDAADFTATTASGQSVQADPNDSIIATGKDPALRDGVPAGKTAPIALAFDFSPAPKSPVTQLTIKDPTAGATVTIKLV